MIGVLLMKLMPLMAAGYFTASSMNMFDDIINRVTIVRDEYNCQIINKQIMLRCALKGNYPPEYTAEDVIKALKEEDLLAEQSPFPYGCDLHPAEGNDPPYFYVDYEKWEAKTGDKNVQDAVGGLLESVDEVKKQQDKQREAAEQMVDVLEEFKQSQEGQDGEKKEEEYYFVDFNF